ncbi:MAG: AI-2E family transporter [Balneolaceae bacterium]|nr:AI-2E family transporter [Balneolaceae bacterium]
MEKYPLAVRYLIRLLLLFAVITILIIMEQLLVPLVFSFLLAYLLYPAARRLENYNIPRIATNFIVIVCFMIGVLGTIYLISVLTASATQDFPELKEQFQQNMQAFKSTLAGVLGISSEQQLKISQFFGGENEFVAAIFRYLKNILVGLGLIPVYTFLLLFYRNKFGDFIFMLVPAKNKENAHNIIERASEVVPKYLKGLITVCIILVGLNSLGFYLIGVEYALLLGLVAAIFNLIPYLGTVIGYGIVFLVVMTTQSPSLAYWILIQFFGVQFLENNILTPNITGSYVQINPLVIIFSLIAAGLVWGLAGMFMVIPVLGMLKIVCENIESLKPVGFLLGTRGTEKHAITISLLRKKFGWERK